MRYVRLHGVVGVVLAGFLACGLALAQQAVYGHSQGKFLPDLKVTPGAVDPSLAADLSKAPHMVAGVEHNICAADFRTPPFRVATKSQKIKTAVCKAYGILNGCPGSQWELDDIIPIEVGGQNIQINLWPQPIVEARVKDHQVEDLLGGPKGLVCRGKISLSDAQSCIVNDWTACAVRIAALK
jgi:hypothetical protein